MTKHRDILSDEMARQRIEGSSYLRYIYTEIYSEFFRIMSCNKDLRVLEIGSGGTSFAKNFWSNVLETSYSLDGGMEAEKLEFNDNSFDLVIAKDVLHHIKDIPQAFHEFSRVLAKNGKVLASEPSWSILGRFVYKFLHEEPWKVNDVFILDTRDPWDSNQALIFNLKRLDSAQRRKVLGNFTMKILRSTYGLSYLISGGVHSQTKISPKVLESCHRKLGRVTRKFDWLFSLNRIVFFEKSVK